MNKKSWITSHLFSRFSSIKEKAQKSDWTWDLTGNFLNFLKNILLSLRAELKGSRSEAFKNFTGQDSPILCVFYKSMPLRCAILAAICAVDFAAMFKDMSITAGDLATKSYKSRKFFEFMESPWLSNTSRQTIKQSVSMFLHGSLSNLHFDLSWTMTPFPLIWRDSRPTSLLSF